jgi:hypothetical protein
MKKITSLLTLVSLFVFGVLNVTQVVMASTTANVAATVTVQNISVSVSDGSVSYGTLAVNTAKSTLSGGVNDQQTASNDGNVAEDFNIAGNNSTDWTLDTDNSTIDHYIHKFCVATCGTDASPTNFTALTTGYSALATNKAASGTQTFDLQLTTPQSSSVFTQQSVNVTVQAVIH